MTEIMWTSYDNSYIGSENPLHPCNMDFDDLNPEYSDGKVRDGDSISCALSGLIHEGVAIDFDGRMIIFIDNDTNEEMKCSYSQLRSINGTQV